MKKKIDKRTEEEHKDELLAGLMEQGKKDGHLTYEELIEVTETNNIPEKYLNEFLKSLEKENIELIMRDAEKNDSDEDHSKEIKRLKIEDKNEEEDEDDIETEDAEDIIK